MILQMGGGGAKELAVKVQIGATQPTGSAGMLWVETTAASNKWTAAVAEPGSPASGDIWVQTDGVNAHVIEMLRKNSIRINVLRVRQYDGTAWVSRNAHYHDGTGWTQVSSAFNPATDISYTGTMVLTVGENGRWDIELQTSGTLTFAVAPPDGVDMFLMGGGGGSPNLVYGGGAGSGYTYTKMNIAVVAGTGYPIVIGAGGVGTAGGTTTALGESAPGGAAAVENNGAAGGCGGGAAGNGVVGGPGGTNGGNGTTTSTGTGGTGQGTTTRAYGEATGTLYGGGGAGASNQTPYASGGLPGGGAGGGPGSGLGKAGVANTGGGAGGTYAGSGTGEAGGSGIVLMRDHRAA